MANGEIALFEQFLRLSHCFQKSSAVEASESFYMWKRVKRTKMVLHVFERFENDLKSEALTR